MVEKDQRRQAGRQAVSCSFESTHGVRRTVRAFSARNIGGCVREREKERGQHILGEQSTSHVGRLVRRDDTLCADRWTTCTCSTE